MNDEHRGHHGHRHEDFPEISRTPAPRRPYERPQIAWEEDLKVRGGISAACTRLPSQMETCSMNPSTS